MTANPFVRAFISHISEEAEIASHLKKALDQDFLGNLLVFVSSDRESIAAGEDWLNAIDQALRNSKLLLILCSPKSIRRPWINFEAGAAWMLDIPIIPLCHSGLTPHDLPMPLSLKQGLLLDNPGGVERLYQRVAKELLCRVPKRSFEELAAELSRLSVQRVGADQLEYRQLENDRGIGKRPSEALSKKNKWRTLERVAFEAAISEEIAADLLRGNDDVRFSKGKNGLTIVGLRSRVGN